MRASPVSLILNLSTRVRTEMGLPSGRSSSLLSRATLSQTQGRRRPIFNARNPDTHQPWLGDSLAGRHRRPGKGSDYHRCLKRTLGMSGPTPVYPSNSRLRGAGQQLGPDPRTATGCQGSSGGRAPHDPTNAGGQVSANHRGVYE